MTSYDFIVIGAGHNGLICATLLARAGRRVLVVEAADRVGGLAREREFHPGFRVAVPHSFQGLSSGLVRELDLRRFGFELGAETLPTTALEPAGEHVVIESDSVSGVGPADRGALIRYRRQLQTFADALAPFWRKTMPPIGGTGPRGLLTFAQLGLKLRLLGRTDMLEFFRMAALPMRDLVDEYFDSELLKAALCWDGLVGSKLAPRSPNQAVLTLLNRMAGEHRGEHSLPATGIGSFVNALRGAAEAAGVELRLQAPVARLLVETDGNGPRCAGVELASGESLRAAGTVSSADPRTTFLRLLGAAPLEIGFSNRIRRLRCEGYVAKLHLALSGLPEFTGIGRPDGRMLIAPSMDAIEFAYDDAKFGDCSAEPVMELLIPSLRQAGLAPAGQHVLSAHVMYVPAHRRGGWDAQARDALIERLLATLESYAPGIRALVLRAELLTPQDLEREYLVTGGHWHHAEPAVDQLLMMRPTYEAAQYRTPVEGLFLCGAGSHPGGDLNGNPGRNAAREILA